MEVDRRDAKGKWFFSFPVALFYLTLFLSRGGANPFIPVWFTAAGLSGASIGIVLGLPGIARLVTGPLIGVWADKFRERRTALTIIAAVEAAAFGGLVFAHGFFQMLVCWFVISTAHSSALPLIDFVALRTSVGRAFHYGWYRSIASAAYAVANAAVGFLVAAVGPVSIVYWGGVFPILASAASRTLKEPVMRPGENRYTPDQPKVIEVVRSRGFLTMILALGLIEGSHAYYYNFSVLTWKAQGIASGDIGLLWGMTIVAEVAFLVLGDRFRTWIGPRRLLVMAGGFSVLRWVCLWRLPGLPMLWLLQTLHALSFTAAMVAGLQLVGRILPERLNPLGQSLASALTAGFASGVLSVIGGHLRADLHADVYLVMASVAAVGTALAFGMRLKPLDEGLAVG